MRPLREANLTRAGQMLYTKRRVDPSFDFAWHNHAAYELTLIVRSTGRRFVGDHMEAYGAGDLVLLGPNLPHTWASDPSPGLHEAIVVQFDPKVLPFNDGVAFRPVRGLLESASRGLAFSGASQTEVSSRLSQIVDLSPLGQLGELMRILDQLSASKEARFLANRTLAQRFVADKPHPIDRVLAFVERNFKRGITGDEIAQVAGMSPSAFSRFFRRTTGRTFSVYLIERRITYACHLLVETESAIAQIAVDSGFTNLSHFNRCFLELKNTRPRDYRRAARPPARMAP